MLPASKREELAKMKQCRFAETTRRARGLDFPHRGKGIPGPPAGGRTTGRKIPPRCPLGTWPEGPQKMKRNQYSETTCRVMCRTMASTLEYE